MPRCQKAQPRAFQPVASPAPIAGRCAAKVRPKPEQGREGGYCERPPLKGQARCRSHGGGSGQAKRAAAYRLAEEEAAHYLARYGQPVAVHPADALLETVHSRYGDLLALRDAVLELAPDELAWGETEVKMVGASQFPGVDRTSGARLHPMVVLYDKTLTELTRSSEISLKTDVMLKREQRDAELGGYLLDALVRLAGLLGHDTGDALVLDAIDAALGSGAKALEA